MRTGTYEAGTSKCISETFRWKLFPRLEKRGTSRRNRFAVNPRHKVTVELIDSHRKQAVLPNEALALKQLYAASNKSWSREYGPKQIDSAILDQPAKDSPTSNKSIPTVHLRIPVSIVTEQSLHV